MRKRLLNCDFVCSSSFRRSINTKAQLLYFNMFASADDKGFVDNTKDIISALIESDDSNELLNDSYNVALQDLVDRGYLYKFTDNHNNNIYVIRHWYCHNVYNPRLQTNYFKLLSCLGLNDGEYTLKRKEKKREVKEYNIKEYNIKEISNNYSYNEIDIHNCTNVSNNTNNEDKCNNVDTQEFDKTMNELEELNKGDNTDEN